MVRRSATRDFTVLLSSSPCQKKKAAPTREKEREPPATAVNEGGNGTGAGAQTEKGKGKVPPVSPAYLRKEQAQLKRVFDWLGKNGGRYLRQQRLSPPLPTRAAADDAGSDGTTTSTGVMKRASQQAPTGPTVEAGKLSSSGGSGSGVDLIDEHFHTRSLAHSAQLLSPARETVRGFGVGSGSAAAVTNAAADGWSGSGNGNADADAKELQLRQRMAQAYHQMFAFHPVVAGDATQRRRVGDRGDRAGG